MSALPLGSTTPSADQRPTRSQPNEGASVDPVRSRRASFVRFVDDGVRDQLCEEAWRARALVARPGPTLPGKLSRALEAAIEAALARRGAMPPVTDADADAEWVVSDQLFRAAALPAREIVVCMPPLRALAEKGRLRDEDAATLTAWMEAARSETRLTVGVLLDDADRHIELRVPRPLDEIVWDVGASSLLRPVEESRRTDLSPPPVAPTLRPCDEDDSAAAAVAAEDLAPADDGDEGQDLAQVLTSAEETRLPDLELAPSPTLEEREARREAELRLEEERWAAEARHLEAERLEAERLEAERAERARLEAERLEAERAERARLEAEKEEEQRAARLLLAQSWRAQAMELDAARGPKPAAQVEKLFVERYLPLLAAARRGEVDATAREIIRGWRDSFAESYEGAFASIRVTGKRPSMVMDAPEVAHRVARLASARSVKLVLVDAMSFELGERVSERLRKSLDQRAVLVERTLLWAALPTITPVQMHLLARGQQGFSDLPATPSEPDITRGRNVAAFRRERLGAREVLKLDLVEARLRAPGASHDERLDAVAEEVTDALLKLFEAMPPRTLVYVFGDHGFVLSAGQNGWATGPAVSGGGSPEEVLVAGQAWLVDAVQ